MKILAISLLRLGDILMAAPALANLRKKYPDARIDILVNKKFEGAANFLPMVDRWLLFPREELQASLCGPQRPIFEAYDEITKLTEALSAEGYDLAINLTQNRTSGYLMGLIESKAKIGMALNSDGQATFGSPWFKFLNDVTATGGRTTFHFSDVFRFGIGHEESAESEMPKTALEETAPIVIQPLTSDSKKDWGFANWVAMLKTLRQLGVGSRVVALGAPFEEVRLNELQQLSRGAGLDLELMICDLPRALEQLNGARVLITADTAIKHLANFASTGVVEICLGSSVARQTGIYKPNSLILSPKTKCAPCPHGSGCSQSSHLCAQDLVPEVVAAAVFHFLRKDWVNIRQLASAEWDQVNVCRTAITPSGFWFAENLSDKATTENIDLLSELASWKLLLDREHLKSLGEFGSEGLRVARFYARRTTPQMKVIANQLEEHALKTESKLNLLLSRLSRSVRDSLGVPGTEFVDQDIRAEISEIEKEAGIGSMLSSHFANENELSFWSIRQFQSKLNDVFNQQGIKARILRGLRNHLSESV